MARYQVKTRMRLNGDGEIGAWMFVLSPIVQGFAWWWHAYGANWIALGVIALAGMTFLGGAILLLIGREYESWVDDVGR